MPYLHSISARRLLLALSLLGISLLPTSASAHELLLMKSLLASTPTVVDFSGSSLSEGDLVSNEFAGVSFTGTVLALPGAPRTAFSGPDFADTPIATPGFEGEFITSTLFTGSGTVDPLVISFDLPASDVSFLLADVEVTVQSGPDVFTATAFDNLGGIIETISFTASGPSRTGNGEVREISFSANNISSLSVTVTNDDGDAGFGIDSLQFKPVPEVGGAVLTGSAIAAFGLFWFSRRRRHAV